MIFSQIFCTAQEQLEIFRSSIKILFLSIQGRTTTGCILQKPVHSCAGEGPHCRRRSRSDHCREGGSSAGEHERRPGGVQVGQVWFLYREFNWISFSSRIAIFMPNIILKVISRHYYLFQMRLVKNLKEKLFLELGLKLRLQFLIRNMILLKKLKN